jgi:flagellar basal body rod protein FlgG
MPVKGIVDTARSLAYYLRLQEVTANNLANAQTDAFKADRLTAWVLPGGETPVPVQQIDLQQGAFRDTGRPLDVALDGQGFLVVATDAGERLTRGGSLQLDAAGRLTDAQGNPLLGTDGPIAVHGADLALQDDGTVLVDGAAVGRLRMVNVDDPAALLKEGYGRFVAAGPLASAPESTRLRQGAVEEPNVNPLTSMVDLVTIQRAYAANLDALKAMDSVLATVTTEVGKVS